MSIPIGEFGANENNILKKGKPSKTSYQVTRCQPNWISKEIGPKEGGQERVQGGGATRPTKGFTRQIQNKTVGQLL